MTKHPRIDKSALLILVLLALALRLYRLPAQPLSWDEGWSVGLSSLPYGEINRITALDVHPPLYYYALKPWLALGYSQLIIRFLSVAAGVLTVPLLYGAGRVWAGRRVGLWAAVIATTSPFLIYYAQVARMYSVSAALGVATAWALLAALRRNQFWAYALFVLCATVTLYTFYYSAFILAALFLYGVWVQPRRWLLLLAAGLAIVLLYTPWLVYAVPRMVERVGTRTGMSFALGDALRFAGDGAYGLVFAYGAGWVAVYLIGAVLLAGAALAVARKESLRSLALPALAILFTLLAVSAGAKAHMFAARYLISASPFLALALGWALDVLLHRARWLGALGALLVCAAIVPTFPGHVYDKFYEVSGPFDPQADYRYLRDKVRQDDVVFFNVLSLAGHYAAFRNTGDPVWSYTLRWDPVIEPLDVAVQRIREAAATHPRLWFVLYKGTVAANLDLKEWLDLNMFPVFGQWREDTLYEEYLPGNPDMAPLSLNTVFDGRIALTGAAFAPSVHANDGLAVQLTWRSNGDIAEQLKVFVHLYATDGRLMAQHDAVPVNELRPTPTWQRGEMVRDNHGLRLDDVSGSLRLVVGLYDPATNMRLQTADGADHAELGLVEVLP